VNKKLVFLSQRERELNIQALAINGTRNPK
jgi:hypothetical protein